MKEWTLTKVRPDERHRVRPQPPLSRRGAGPLRHQQRHRLPRHQAVPRRRGRLRLRRASRSSRCCSPRTRNFRPVALQFGPDGALYIVDWFNPLIGHMQYSLRDPRPRHAARPRLARDGEGASAAAAADASHGEPIAAQLDNAEGVRGSHALLDAAALREQPTEQVVAALGTWVARSTRPIRRLRASPARGALGLPAPRRRRARSAAAAARREGVPRAGGRGARAAALVRQDRGRHGADGDDGQRPVAARAARGGAVAELRRDARRRPTPRSTC